MDEKLLKKLPEGIRRKVEEQPPRLLAGYWNTRELANLLGIGTWSVAMQMRRGLIEPVERKQGQQCIFTDEAVVAYLTRPRTGKNPMRILTETKCCKCNKGGVKCRS